MNIAYLEARFGSYKKRKPTSRLVVAGRLRKSREALGLSRKEIAFLLKCDERTVRNMESGDYNHMLAKVSMWAEITDKDINHFIN